MPATTMHHIWLLMLDVEPQIEMHTEKVRRLVIPKGVAGICETPPDTTAIDAARIMVGGEWHRAPTHTRTVHYITMKTNDGIYTHVEIPDGFTLLQRTLPMPTSDDPQAMVFTQYALVHTLAYKAPDIIHTTKRTPPPDTTTT